MRKNNLWFTFIEILVVISILAIVSAFSISSFNKSFERQSLKSEINIFADTIKNLDNDIWVSITDYNLYILTGSYYYYYTNNLYKNTIQDISFTSMSGSSFTWMIKTNDTIKNDMNLQIYFNTKKINTTSVSSTGTFFYDISTKWKYEFKTFIGELSLNPISLEFFSKTDIKKPIDVMNIKDEFWNTYTWVIIKNNLWKKVFTTMTGMVIEKLNINFEMIGSTESLQLINK